MEDVPFAGSSRYAPTSVLKALSDQQQHHEANLNSQDQQQSDQGAKYVHSPLPQHDVESLIKVCLARCYPSVKSSLRLIDSKDFTSLHEFWIHEEHMMQNCDSSWYTALEWARGNDVERAKAAVLHIVYREVSPTLLS